MDISDIEKKLGIEGMSAEEQMAMVVALQKSAQEKTQRARDETIGKSAELVIQGLKKIKSDIESRFSELNDTFQAKVSSLQNGKDGRDGKDGKDGLDGKQGLQGSHGKDGRDGRNGVDGADGISVTSARIDFDGSLIIGLSSGVELNVGEVVAPDLAERIKVITNGGGTSQSVLDTLTSLQTQIDNLIPSQTGNSGKFLTTNGTTLSWASASAGGGLSYQGTWNASTNTPTLASSTGTNGYYYVVSVAGSTNLNGITDWAVGDWLIFNGTAWQKIDQSETLQFVTSTDGSVTVTTTGSTADLSVAVAASTTNVICQVRNTTGATLTKGTAVYISGATGQIPTVTKAQANSDTASAQTLGLMSADLANNSNGYVTIIGLITEIDTSAFTDGQQLYLSGTTAGALTATKTYAPTHLVYVAVVEYAHAIHGKLFVKVQNGYELDEIHNVSAQSPSNGQTLIYNASTSLWEKANLTAGTGISVTNGAGSITVANTGVTSALAGTGISVSGSTGAVTISNTGVTSVTGTSPVASSGGATPAISLSSGYGDTQNPYASKTANYVLAAPNGTAGVPTFRAVVAADIPTLNQNTTGSAATLTTGRTISISGDLTYTSPSFNGSANVTAAGTLATVNANVGSFTNASITVNGKGLITAASSGTAPVTSVTGTSPVVSSGGTTPAISLASGYGDTQNPYASKTANYFLSAPNGTAGAPTFRAIVAADIPTLNQNTTGSAAKWTTARTESLTGDITGSASVDGSANWSIATTLATVNSNVGTFTKITVNGKGLATAASQASLSDLSSPTGSFSFNSQNITNLLDPVNAQDAATKNYVDSVAQGLDAKASCICATTANITLSGTQTIDGIAVVAGNRVLVKNQTTASQNGIYVVAAGAWTRSTDMNAWTQVPNAFTFIETGSTQADTGWVCTADTGGTIGTTSVTWTQFSGAGTYTAGTGLTLTGTQFSITNAGTAGTYGSATQTPVLTTNAQGQVTSVTNTTITPAVGSITGLGTGMATFLFTPTSSNLAATVTDETGSGALVFATSPTLVTPILGTPQSGNFSTGTFTWPTFNQNTTGTASNVTGTVAIANGGTGQTTQANALTALTGTQTSGYYVRSNGTSSSLSAIQASDVPTLNQNTTGTASNVTGTVAVANGGTGQTTANAAFNALAPSQTSNSGKYLTTDGTNTSWATVGASSPPALNITMQQNFGGFL